MPAVRALVLVLLAALPLNAAIPTAERNALLALYASTDGPNWKSRAGWNGPAGTECSWAQLECDPAGTTVTALFLGYNNLTGTLPSDIGALSSLKQLSLTGNNLTGPIPAEVNSLRNLEVFDARANGFTSLPPSVSALTSLKTFIASSNQLSGMLPQGMENLQNLEELTLSSNKLDGPLPAGLLTLGKLKTLVVNGNSLSGALPPAIANLRSLETLVLGGNYFSGVLPDAFGNFTALEKLDLSSNDFTGPLPPTFSRMIVLEDLRVERNDFVSPLPDLSQLSNLRVFDVSYNDFAEEIPAWLGTLTRLEAIAMGLTSFRGSLPRNLGNLTALKYFNSSFSKLSGPLPVELLRLPLLENLELAFNDLTGVIPPEIAQLTNLTSLDLGGNEFQSPVPKELFGMTKLLVLSLRTNKFDEELDPRIGQLVNLIALDVESGSFKGVIPKELGALTKLRYLSLAGNRFGGGVPSELQQLVELREFRLSSNQLTQLNADMISKLPKLQRLHADNNLFIGAFPLQLTGNSSLQFLYLDRNLFDGPVPPAIGTMTALQELSLARNSFSGAIPSQLGALTKLRKLDLSHNVLEGTIPIEITALSDLREGYFTGNKLTTLPDYIGDFKAIEHLRLDVNRITGALPATLGKLTTLQSLNISENALVGPIPDTLLQLVNLGAGKLNLRYNGLYTSNPALRLFLNQKSLFGEWESTQTVAPANVKIDLVKSDSVVLSWTPITLSDGPGGYVITAMTSSGQRAAVVTTATKRLSSGIITGLTPLTSYNISVAAVSYPSYTQRNVVSSSPSPAMPATTTAAVLAPARIIVSQQPGPITQLVGSTGAKAFYSITNYGDVGTTVTLSTTSTFFQHERATITIAAGANTSIAVVGVAQPAGFYEGLSVVNGDGANNLEVRVRMIVTDPPSGNVIAEAGASRVDVSAPADQNPTGTAEFRNPGNVRVAGVAVADVPWIIPPSGVIRIEPNSSTTVTFTIDRTKRPDADALTGALVGHLYLVYPTASPSGRTSHESPPNGIAVVKVIDTVRPGLNTTPIPRLEANEWLLAIPGVGSVTGELNTRFITDVSILNAHGVADLKGIKLYYTSAANHPAVDLAASLSNLSAGQGVAFGDVAKSVFSQDGRIGTLFVRGTEIGSVSVNASFFNIGNPAGTFGNVVPVFRSDRAAKSGQVVHLTGVENSTAVRTNLFVQEMTGAATTFSITFFDQAGNIVPYVNEANVPVGSLDGSVNPFKLIPIFNRVPVNAIAADVRNTGGSNAGAIVAFATPVDNQSNDFWSVVDWRRTFDTGSTRQIIPVIGHVHGLNQTFFRSDMSVRNVGEREESVTLDYIRSDGSSRRQSLRVPPRSTLVRSDVVASLFGSNDDSIGYVSVVSASENLTVATRTYATVEGLPGTFGMAVPATDPDSVIRFGASRAIDEIQSASTATIDRRKGGTFRTNFGIVETEGKPVVVDVTVALPDRAARIFIRRQVASFRFEVPANGFLFITDLAKRLASVPGDVREAQLTFKVVSGEGGVIVFTSSVDNGTGDSLFRIE